MTELASGDGSDRKASWISPPRGRKWSGKTASAPSAMRKSIYYARDRKFAETAAALSLLCETPFEVVERALLDPGAELVLILAKVAGLSPATTKVVLLLRAADRGFSADAIEQHWQASSACSPRPPVACLSFFRRAHEKAGGAHGVRRLSPSNG